MQSTLDAMQQRSLASDSNNLQNVPLTNIATMSHSVVHAEPWQRELEAMAKKLMCTEAENARLRDLIDELRAATLARADELSTRGDQGSERNAESIEMILDAELTGSGQTKGFTYEEARLLLRSRIDLVSMLFIYLSIRM